MATAARPAAEAAAQVLNAMDDEQMELLVSLLQASTIKRLTDRLSGAADPTWASYAAARPGPGPAPSPEGARNVDNQDRRHFNSGEGGGFQGGGDYLGGEGGGGQRQGGKGYRGGGGGGAFGGRGKGGGKDNRGGGGKGFSPNAPPTVAAPPLDQPENLPPSVRETNELIAFQVATGTPWKLVGPPPQDHPATFKWNLMQRDAVSNEDKQQIRQLLQAYANEHGIALSGDSSVKLALRRDKYWVSYAGGISSVAGGSADTTIYTP